MPRRLYRAGLSDEVKESLSLEVKEVTETWLSHQGSALVKKTVQEHHTELLRDVEWAHAVERDELWDAISKLRHAVGKEPCEPQLSEAPSGRLLDDTVLDEVQACTTRIDESERRFDHELRRTREVAESCVLAMHKHVEEMNTCLESCSNRVKVLEGHRDETLSALEKKTQEIEVMREVIASDLIRFASDQIKTKQDLETYSWAKTGHVIESGHSKPRLTALSSKSQELDVGDMRCKDSYELQPSIWDAALFFGVKGLASREQLLLAAGYVVNVTLQSVFSLMVVRLGRDDEVVDDQAITKMEAWNEQAETWEVASVCGDAHNYTLSTSYLQMMLMDEVDAYFEEAIFSFSWGPLLTIMVVALWSGAMVSHARTVFDFTVALWQITSWERDASTIFTVNLRSNVEIVAVARLRFLWMSVSVVLQTFVIVVLLVFGCVWMARSSSVTELLLNAVSLAFIMDADELLFRIVVPTLVKNLIRRIEPLRLRPTRSSGYHLRSTVSLSTILIFVIFFWIFPVSETSQRLTKVSSALCGS